MTDWPLVSVIIPTYNRVGLIARTIENIFEQTYPKIELIVVDDGSTDDTGRVLASYGGRIRWVWQPNAGSSAARNRGIKMAHGEFVAFQDSDDAWHPSKIERQVSLLERAGETVPCCICNTDIYIPDGRVVDSFSVALLNPPYEEGLWTNVAEVLATRFVLFNQAAMIRRSAMEKTGGFDERLRCMQDHEMAIRLGCAGPWAFIRTPLVKQNQGTANSASRAFIGRPLLLAETNMRKCEIVLERLPKDREGARLRVVMERQLRQAKRELKITKMTYGSSRVGRLAGSMSSKLQRVRAALRRRTPWYPKMKVRAASPDARLQSQASKVDEA